MESCGCPDVLVRNNGGAFLDPPFSFAFPVGYQEVPVAPSSFRAVPELTLLSESSRYAPLSCRGSVSEPKH